MRAVADGDAVQARHPLRALVPCKERACSSVVADLSTAPKLLAGRIDEHTDELELTTEDARLPRRCRVLPRLSSASGSHRPPPCRRRCRRGVVGAVRTLSARWSGRASPRPHIRPRSLDKFRLGQGGAVAWCDGCRRMVRGCRRRWLLPDTGLASQDPRSSGQFNVPMHFIILSVRLVAFSGGCRRASRSRVPALLPREETRQPQA